MSSNLHKCNTCKRIGRWTKSRCPDCQRAYDHARNQVKAQRYDAAHKAQRKLWERAIQASPVLCSRCGKAICNGMPWHLDHLPGGISAPSHALCNARARWTDAL